MITMTVAVLKHECARGIIHVITERLETRELETDTNGTVVSVCINALEDIASIKLTTFF